MTLHRSIFSALAASIIFVLIDSCSDQRMSQADPSPIQSSQSAATSASASTVGAFNEYVGKPIDRSTALRWIDNFVKANPRATREYVIDASVLKEIMADASCTGISLNYATDGNGSLHILPIGLNRDGKILPMQTISTRSGKIDWRTSQEWISNYAGYIRSHFFGTMTFTRLLDEQRSSQVRVSLALNDAGAPQLLLSNASEISPSLYEDKSSPCPPVCGAN